MKVSIIIPVYNVAQYLDRCLKSCIRQTFKDIEIIIINDGSTDSSSDIISKYEKSDSRIVVINKDNGGLLQARKSGISQACGSYVFHLDGDDYIEENTIDVLYNQAIKSDADIVIGEVFIDNDNKITKNKSLLHEGLQNKKQLMRIFSNNYIFHVWGNLYRKEIVNDVFFPDYDVSIGEDLLQTMQLYFKAEIIYAVTMPLYHYVQRPSSLMSNSDHKLRASRELTCTFAIRDCLMKKLFDEVVVIQLTYIALEKLCFYLRSLGHYGEGKEWMKNFIRDEFICNSKNRDYVFSKNKKIYVVLFVSFFFLQISKLLSDK